MFSICLSNLYSKFQLGVITLLGFYQLRVSALLNEPQMIVKSSHAKSLSCESKSPGEAALALNSHRPTSIHDMVATPAAWPISFVKFRVCMRADFKWHSAPRRADL